jgi:hypothetical protein
MHSLKNDVYYPTTSEVREITCDAKSSQHHRLSPSRTTTKKTDIGETAYIRMYMHKQKNKQENGSSLNPKLSMTIRCPEKLTFPWNCTDITLSSSLQSEGEVLSSAYCFARVSPSVTGFIASVCVTLGLSSGEVELGRKSYRDETG